MTATIAFVGAGPTTVYCLAALLREARRPVAITIFEAQAAAGLGTPYRPGWNDAAMLSNIASIEIPPVTESLCDWLESLPSDELAEAGIPASEIDERSFYPRVVLGRYFEDQLASLVEQARGVGISVDVRTRSRVLDVAPSQGGWRLTVAPRRGEPYTEQFDNAVLATGHQWPAEPQVRPGYFVSPWPASALAEIGPVAVGVRGSSLTAIDVAVALAVTHGAFVEAGDGDLSYVASPNTGGFGLTLMSRKGLLPEADFYCPIPYTPLSFCTPEAVEARMDQGDEGLLDAVFELFRRELLHEDPAWSARMGLEKATLEQFCEHYFADRADADPFVWAQANLEEARRNLAARVTVPWRYAILRMHEVVAPITPHLGPRDFRRFTRHLKPVFVDDYGAVPHESIARLLALHRAGKIEVLALGDDYRIDTHVAGGGVVLRAGDLRRHFPVFIEATGQRPLPAERFPFASLVEHGIVRDVGGDGANPLPRGIEVDDVFHPAPGNRPVETLFCLGLPFLMGRHPFIQGITSSHEMGEVVGRALLDQLEGCGAIIPFSGAEAA